MMLAKEKLHVSSQLLDIIEPPTDDNLEALIAAITQREQRSDAPHTTTTPSATSRGGSSTTGAP